MTHAFMYGTATFEGIRGYWNEEQGQLYVLFLREHMERIRNCAKMLLMEDLPSVDALVDIVVETVRRNGFREDVYIRPSFYKSTRGDRRPAPPPRPRAVRDRDAVRELHRHREGRPDHDLHLAPQRRRGAAGPGQDRRRLREHGVPEVRGGAQRLRRGPGADARRPRLRGVGGQPVRGPRRHPADAAGVGRHPRGRHAQGDRRSWRRTPGSPSRSARSTAPSSTSATRCSCAAPASRSAPSSRSTTGRSARARSARSRG